MLQLGYTPIYIQMSLTRGQDWVVQIDPAPGAQSPVFPIGTTIVVNIYPSTTDITTPITGWTLLYSWSATFNGDSVILRGPRSDTDSIPGGAFVRVVTTYPSMSPEPSDTYVWMKGVVIRND
jgi:hypothetical protein